MSSIPPTSSGSRRAALLLLAAALAVVLVAHLRGIGGAFLSDDYAHLGWIHDASERGTLWSWTLSRFYLPLGSGNYAYRPLAFATYVLDWIAYGANATGWHVTNLILHGVNAALAFVVAARWLGPRAPDATAAGLIAASVLAAFPFAGEVSFWPVGRFDLLACLFSLLYLSTLPFGARPVPLWERRLRLVWLACALLSKESAMPLPAIATFLCFAAGSLAGISAENGLIGRLRFALRETWPTWLVLGAYLGLRAMLFGSLWKVYPDSTLPASLAEFATRVATVRFIVHGTLGSADILWSIAAAALLALCLASWWRARHYAPSASSALAIAVLASALAYAAAPALSFSIAPENGEGARNLYVGWMYFSLAIGLLLARTASPLLMGIAFVLVMLVGQWHSLEAWHDAARQMSAIVAGVPRMAGAIGDDQYAALYLPDHYGIAPFARNAQGGIVMRPTQHIGYLDRMAGMTSSGFGAWPGYLRGGAVATLKPSRHFDAAGFLGLYCWNASVAAFVPLTPAAPALAGNVDEWRSAARRNFDAAGCLPPF